MIKSLHKLKDCHALNLSNIAIKPICMASSTKKDRRNKLFNSGELYYGEPWWGKKAMWEGCYFLASEEKSSALSVFPSQGKSNCTSHYLLPHIYC